MPDKDIFDKDKENNNDDKTNKDVIKPDDKSTDQLLATIVNEDGSQKYKNIEEALSATAHAQKHIKTLESENAELKDKGDNTDKLDELLEAVRKSKGSGEGDKDTSAMKPEDVLGIVESYINDTKIAENKSNNIGVVANLFKERYGKDASEKLYGKAEDLGFSRDEINSMIANNPNAALKVLGEENKSVRKTDIITDKSSVSTRQFDVTPDDKPTSVMGIGSSKDLTDAWNASKQKTLERLGLSET